AGPGGGMEAVARGGGDRHGGAVAGDDRGDGQPQPAAEGGGGVRGGGRVAVDRQPRRLVSRAGPRERHGDAGVAVRRPAGGGAAGDRDDRGPLGGAGRAG